MPRSAARTSLWKSLDSQTRCSTSKSRNHESPRDRRERCDSEVQKGDELHDRGDLSQGQCNPRTEPQASRYWPRAAHHCDRVILARSIRGELGYALAVAFRTGSQARPAAYVRLTLSHKNRADHTYPLAPGIRVDTSLRGNLELFYPSFT